jgi:hypothetical protein
MAEEPLHPFGFGSSYSCFEYSELGLDKMMSFYNDDGKLTLEPGRFRLEVGGCSPSQRGQELGAPKPVRAVFEVK